MPLPILLGAVALPRRRHAALQSLPLEDEEVSANADGCMQLRVAGHGLLGNQLMHALSAAVLVSQLSRETHALSLIHISEPTRPY